jgi:hypothetical protein
MVLKTKLPSSSMGSEQAYCWRTNVLRSQTNRLFHPQGLGQDQTRETTFYSEKWLDRRQETTFYSGKWLDRKQETTFCCEKDTAKVESVFESRPDAAKDQKAAVHNSALSKPRAPASQPDEAGKKLVKKKKKEKATTRP